MTNTTLLIHNYQPLKGQQYDQHIFTDTQLSTIKGAAT